MIDSSIVTFALRKRLLVVVLTLVLIAAGGVIASSELPIEAYPDIADTWVQVITQWPGHAAEEVESQVTDPARDRHERRAAQDGAPLGFARRSFRS